MATFSSSSSPAGAPKIIDDTRYKACRTIIQNGQASVAINMLSTLLEETIEKYGQDSVDAAPCYYEYGNALFRSVLASINNDEDANQKAAEAAEKRASEQQNDDSKPPAAAEDSKPSAAATADEEEEVEEKEGSDVALALEMMETGYAILDEHIQHEEERGETPSQWATEQLHRFLQGIGDVYSFGERFADAFSAYLAVLAYREKIVEAHHDNEEVSLDFLTHRRQLVEAFGVVAEALLACPDGQDVVSDDKTLVKAKERIEYTRGYYERAREELQETVVLMGRLAETNVDIDAAKTDVCFASVLVQSVGESLLAYDEQQVAAESATKKQKTG